MNNGLRLEPMGIGEILDRALVMFRQDFKKYYIITFLGYLPFIVIMVALVLAAVLSGSGETGDFPTGLLIVIIVAAIPAFAGMLVMQGALTKACRDRLFDTEIDIRGCMRFGLKKAFPFFVAGLLMSLAILFGYVFLIIPGIIFTVWFSLVPPVTFLEDSGYAAALGRSRHLIRGHFWRTVGFVTAMSLLGFALIGGLSQAVSLIPLVGQILGMLLQMAVVPFQTIALTLFYYNQRVVREGYDLELRANEMYGSPGGDVSIV